MKIRISILIVLLGLVFADVPTTFGGNPGRTGSSGVMELLIPVGSRGSALGGASNAMTSGVEAIHWNPAGMSRATGVEAMFSTLTYLADIQLNYFAVASNFGDFGSLGLSLRSLNFGDIPITTVDNPEGTGERFSPNFITVGLTYSRAFTDRIHGGVTAKVVTERIVRTSAAGIAFDFGVQYLSSVGLKLAVALKNLGPEMSFDGPDLEYFAAVPGQEQGSRQRALRLAGASFELPSTMEIGLGYDYSFNEENVLSLMGNFENRNVGSDEYKVGLEYGWNNQLFIRGGYMTLDKNQSENIYGPSFGAGVSLPVGGSTITFDYAYRQTDFFDANQWFTLKVGF